jgi:hypothetical protein
LVLLLLLLPLAGASYVRQGSLHQVVLLWQLLQLARGTAAQPLRGLLTGLLLLLLELEGRHCGPPAT